MQREHNVTTVSLYPGLVRTESVMKAAQYVDLSNSESPQFIGRAVAVFAGGKEPGNCRSFFGLYPANQAMTKCR
jgi:hypothetical protein